MKLARTKEWREAHGLTQRELAAEAGVGEATVARVETGGSVAPPTARKIAGALGVAVADLLERPPVPLVEAPSSAGPPVEGVEELSMDDLRHLARGVALTRSNSVLTLGDLPLSRGESVARAQNVADAFVVRDEFLRRGVKPPKEFVFAFAQMFDALTPPPDAESHHGAGRGSSEAG